MKAKIENGKITVYPKLPSKYKSNTLNIAGGFDKLSTSVLEQEGFFEIVTPEYDPDTQELGPLYFNESDKVFTYSYNDLPIYTLAELQVIRKEQLSEVMNEFVLLVTRCKMIHGNANDPLNTVIQATLDMRVQTLLAIDAFTDAKLLKEFKIKPEDVEYYKSLFEPFKL